MGLGSLSPAGDASVPTHPLIHPRPYGCERCFGEGGASRRVLTRPLIRVRSDGKRGSLAMLGVCGCNLNYAFSEEPQGLTQFGGMVDDEGEI
jgi:hypothetical protein